MGIKIEKIEIKNFKVYKDVEFDFENQNLIVFDGPNGFGKTSVYDAIELLFTGKIERYERIKSELVDRREKRNENPFYHYAAEENNPITIKIQFKLSDQTYVLIRSNTQPTETVIDFRNYKLHQLNDFNDVPSQENFIENDHEYFENLLGKNYVSDFEFVNYVEQEDTFYFLKSKETDKKKNIEYLFNTTAFNKKIDRYKILSQRIKDVSDGITSQKTELSTSIQEIKAAFQKKEEITYDRLFQEKEIEWDKEEINFQIVSPTQLFDSETGDFSKVEKLVENREQFLKELHNNSIARIIQQDALLRSFFYYEHFKEIEVQIKEERDLLSEFKDFSELIENFQLEDVKEDIYDVPQLIDTKYGQNAIIIEYKRKLIELKQSFKNSTSASKIYNGLISSRGALINQLEKYHQEIHEDGTCPLCGEDWGKSEELLLGIEKHQGELEDLNKNLDQVLKVQIDAFMSFFKEVLLVELKSLFIDFLYKSDYFDEDYFDKSSKRDRRLISLEFDELNIDCTEFVSKTTTKNIQGFEEFKSYLESKKIAIEDKNLVIELKDVYDGYFDSKNELLELVSKESVQKKRNYINWLYSVNQSKIVSEKEKALKLLEEKAEKLSISKRKIDRIVSSLSDSLNKYNAKLVNDIELLFHLYSGRIMQDYQGGLGLFIINKHSSIKFVTAPDHSYDAVFSMSTGQLSALILSFTLALNKKYSTSKLLLIDDPVQSMDDINTTGFVEVLRNDFDDRQILISTHEQMMSTYVRYKFKKFGFDSARINLSVC